MTEPRCPSQSSDRALHPEDLSHAGLRQRQLDRLRMLLAECAASNPFWQPRLAAAGITAGNACRFPSLDALSQLPLIAKSDLVTDQSRLPPTGSNLTFDPQSYLRLHQTSGTSTGTPLRWLDNAASWSWFMDCWEQNFRIAGVRPADRFCFPFSFGPFIGFWAAFEGAGRNGHLCLAGGGMTSVARLRLTLDNAATVICCTPTYALRLAETAAEEGLNLRDSAVRMLIVAGEPGGSIGPIRSRLEEAWGARVIDHWGMTEIGALGIECAEQPGGLHLLESECIAEIIEPETGAPAVADAAGTLRGELVLTNLGRTGSPLIRYRTGDLVETDPTPCPCGRHLLRLKGGVQGRVDDMLIIRGNNVFPSSIEAVIRELDGVAEYQLVVQPVRSMQQLLIRLEPASSDVGPALRDQLQRRIKDRLNFIPEIELATPGSLPRFELKGRRLTRLEPR